VRTNYPFFINKNEAFDAERQTFQNLNDEATMLYGADCVYIDIENASLDNIFNEYLTKTMTTGTDIRLILDEIEDDLYNQDAGMFSKFGYVPGLEETNFHASQNYFEFHNVFPKEGDLIYYRKVIKMFEISRVVLLDGYRLQLHTRLYNFSHDMISDDIEEAPIQGLEEVMDKEIEAINTPIQQQVEDEEIVDRSENDPLYGLS